MIRNRFFQTSIFLFCLLTLVLTSGCVTEFRKIKNWEHFPWNKTSESPVRKQEQPEPSVEKEKDQPEFLEHRIRWKGETLSIIAKWYMGRIDDWKVLAKVNPELTPQNLQKGEVVRIPAGKVKTSVPMPRDFLGAFGGKAESAEKRKPVKEEKKSVDIGKDHKAGKDDKAGKEPSGETEAKKPTKKAPAGESFDKTDDTEPKDKTADQEQEPDLFGPKELDTE